MATSGARFGMDLAEYAKWFIKPEGFGQVKKEEAEQFEQLKKNKRLEQKIIDVSDVQLKAYELKQAPLAHSATTTPIKKAIFFFPSYRHNMSYAVTVLDDLMTALTRQAHEAGLCVTYTGYLQEYRGRGENRLQEDTKPHFSKHTLKDDAIDVMECIRQMQMFGDYHPKDILLYGEELGANLVLWAKQLLIDKDKRFEQLRLISFHAISNALEYKLAKPFIADQIAANKTLEEAGWIPSSGFYGITSTHENNLHFHAEDHKISNGEAPPIETHPISLYKQLSENKSSVQVAWSLQSMATLSYQSVVLPYANVNVLMLANVLLHNEPLKPNLHETIKQLKHELDDCKISFSVGLFNKTKPELKQAQVAAIKQFLADPLQYDLSSINKIEFNGWADHKLKKVFEKCEALAEEIKLIKQFNEAIVAPLESNYAKMKLSGQS
jgi:hypothetical protein